MNRNLKINTAQINIRVEPKEKEKLKNMAKRCGLTLSEYLVKRASGYEPRAVLPDAFYDFYGELCKLSNSELSPETEEKLLTLIDEIHSELLLPGKKKNMGPPQSLLCGEKEHPRSCESVGACTDCEGRSVM